MLILLIDLQCKGGPLKGLAVIMEMVAVDIGYVEVRAVQSRI